MKDVVERIEGRDPRILILCDHASNRVPDGIDLGISPDLLDRHIAIDIGAAPVTRALAAALGVPALLATVSRLVIDLNREPDHPGLIPTASDGHAIPGNADADRAARIARYHAPYHAAIAARIAQARPDVIVAVHSFTPELEVGNPAPRPWEIGILSNRRRAAADLAIASLARAGVMVGDNQPYSGQVLNGTLNRHAEDAGIESFGIELRNDMIRDPAGVARWAAILHAMIVEVRSGLAQTGLPAT